MLHMKLIARSFVLAVALLALVACTVSQLTVALNVVADAASLAAVTAPILSGTIPVPMVTLIVDYSGQVSAAVVKVQSELNSGDPNALKASTIIADFAAIAVPDIPGAPANAVALVNGIASAVRLFITQIETQLGSGSTTARMAKVAAWKPGMADRRKIGQAVSTAKATMAAVAAYHAGHK